MKLMDSNEPQQHALPQPYPLTVQLFAGASAAVGRKAVEVYVAPHATVADLAQAMAKAYPELKSWLPHCRWAIGTEFVELERPLRAADGERVVAMIPPVSGG